MLHGIVDLCILGNCINAWRCLALRPRSPDFDMEAMLLEPITRLAQANAMETACRSTLRWLYKLKTRYLRADRRESALRFTRRAATAAERNDHATTYKIIQALVGKPPRPLKALKDIDGKVLTDGPSIARRWLQHHVGVLNADVAPCPTTACPTTAPRFCNSGSRFRPSVDDVRDQVARMSGNKAFGPDGISATVLRAGGWHAA